MKFPIVKCIRYCEKYINLDTNVTFSDLVHLIQIILRDILAS